MERFLRKKYCDNDNFFITMLTRVENIDYPTNDEISEKQVTTFCKKNKCQQIMDNVPVQEYMKLGIFLKGLKKKTLSYLINVLSEVCKEEDASENSSEDSSLESSSSESSSEYSSEDSSEYSSSSSDDSTLEEKEFEEWKHKFQTALDVFRSTSNIMISITTRKDVYEICDDVTMFIRKMMVWVQSIDYEKKRKDVVDVVCPDGGCSSDSSEQFDIQGDDIFHVKHGKKYRVIQEMNPRKRRKICGRQ